MFYCTLLALVLIGSLLTPARAFTMGQSASLVIGQGDFSHAVSNANQTRLFQPFSSAFDAAGNLWVADQLNNRVLMFKPPFSNGLPASLVIGQPDFTQHSNAVGQTGLYDPAGVVFDASGNLWVADAVNNRVLMFKPPFATGMAASLVIGQTTFATNDPATTQSGLWVPYGVTFDAVGDLWLAEMNNNRAVMFKPPFINGMAASLVIGQTDFNHNNAPSPTQTGLHNPMGVAFDVSGNLWVAEASNHRVLMFKPPFSNGKAASVVIGQADFTHKVADTNQTRLYGPTGIAFDASGSLWVADRINSRILKFTAPFGNGMAASLVIGQPGFTSTLFGTSQSVLSYPTSVIFDALGNLWVADQNNNRVLMFAGSTGLSGFLLELQAGWNLISLPVVPTQTATAKLLAPLIQLHELVTVWGFTPPNTWSYFKPPNLGTLTSMVDGKGYWVFVTDAINITIVGYVITPGSAPPTYPLATGWNLVGFKPQPIGNETVATYLTSINMKYTVAWVYNNLNATWIKATPGLQLAPGQGMWIYMTAPATLIPQ